MTGAANGEPQPHRETVCTRSLAGYGDAVSHGDLSLTGANLVDGAWSASGDRVLVGVDPRRGTALSPEFHTATPAEVADACAAASRAFAVTRHSSGDERAVLLDDIAARLDAAADAVIDRAEAETALGRERLAGELARTTTQLRLFASVARRDEWRRTTREPALPARQPTPRPSLVRSAIPLGPVAVFAASNFPLAFSVAGGDTASALAVGCPVVVKAHESHPGTSELVARVIANAIAAAGWPAGAFGLLQGDGREVAPHLVNDPHIAAVAFTGSHAGGMAVAELARGRSRPIPVFAEMGSSNPVFVLPDAVRVAGNDIADAVAASVVLGNGQFCTKPGLVFGVDGPEWRQFAARLAKAVADAGHGPLLNERIATEFDAGVARRAAAADAVAAGDTPPHVLVVDHDTWLAEDAFTDELFGPGALLIGCRDLETLAAVPSRLAGELTATVHRRAGDDELAVGLIDELLLVAGRIVVDGVPTGVEVTAAMHHGGPYPATTDSRFTSVGTDAVARFVRPVCLQGVPEELLPQWSRGNAFPKTDASDASDAPSAGV